MLCDLVGFNLMKGNEKIATSNVDAEIIGLYFSAHWCPPCRGFTPQLAQRYTQIKTKRKSFEIIFLSMDKDDNSFRDYYNIMPWLAVPFTSKHIITALSVRYGVNGIPALIIINRKGELKEKEGRKQIMNDNFINTFPYYIDPSIHNESIEDTFNNFMADEKIDHKFKFNALTTLFTVFTNISQNPGEPKYLKLKKSNNSVKTKLGHPDLIKMLKHAGFVENTDVYDISDTVNYSKLKEVTDLLSGVLHSMQAK